TSPTRNLFFVGSETRKVCPSLIMSKMVLETIGACPIMRISAGRFARRNAFTSWYSSIRPLYLDPAVGRKSTVAFRDFVLVARALNFSTSSSRVASLIIGISFFGIWWSVLTRGHPPAKTDSVSNPRHIHTRRMNALRPSSLFSAILCPAASSAKDRFLVRPRDVHIKWLQSRPHAANGFTWPKRFAQDREPAIFQLADHTKSIARVSRLIGIQAAFRKVAFEFRVRLQRL